MVKSTGLKKINSAVFISGTGTNLLNLINYSFIKKSKIKVCLVISDNSKAKVLILQKNLKLKKRLLDFKIK